MSMKHVESYVHNNMEECVIKPVLGYVRIHHNFFCQWMEDIPNLKIRSYYLQKLGLSFYHILHLLLDLHTFMTDIVYNTILKQLQILM